MNVRVRQAEPADVPAIAALLLRDAAVRETLGPALWAVPPDARARVEASLGTIANPITGPVRHRWLVAEADGAVAGVAHGANLPPPPIVDLGGGTAGVLLDDSHLSADVRVSSVLLEAVERAMADAGAVLFVAASPSGWTDRTAFLAGAGYETTTLYMVKAGLAAEQAVGLSRPATEKDLDGIVRLSALHRERLRAANPVFWNIHADADARFAGWMRATLAMPDRSMFVSGPPGAVGGFIIAQPGSPLHLAAAHDLSRVGLIDDFYADAFEAGAPSAEQDGAPSALLFSAEAAFRAQRIDTALAICPARMRAKADALGSAGYATANLWMVKPSSPSQAA